MRNLKALWFLGCGFVLLTIAALDLAGYDLFLPYLALR
jgi:hypothetical protein